jgi:hypothetical protein
MKDGGTGPATVRAEPSPPPHRLSGRAGEPGPPSWIVLAARVGGPILLIAGVLLILRDFAFAGLISTQHPDVLAYWLPTHCFLGASLRAGHIPAWNPHVMGGYPFAADPQSGWLNLPAMLLHTTFPCGVAMRWMVVSQPIIGGLALYAFLRGEGLSRPAATIGGLSLALPISASVTVLSLPLAGSVVWIAVTLAVASRLFAARSWPARLMWLGAVALAWGQVAAAHLSHGAVMGTGALAAYVVARTVTDVRRGSRTRRDGVLLIALLLLALPVVNLALLLPRIGYMPRTTLGLGYAGLKELHADIVGGTPRPIGVGVAIGKEWPLMLALSPGAYLGAGALALSFAGLWSRRRLGLAVAFSAFGLISYLLALESFAAWALPLVRALPFGDVYLHAPMRFGMGLLVAVPVLAGLGLDAWREQARPGRRVAMLAPAALVWGVLPLVGGADPGRLTLLLIGGMAAAAILVTAAVRPAWRGVLIGTLPLILAVELSVNGLLGQMGSEVRPVGLDVLRPRPLTNLKKPHVDMDAYLRPGPIAGALSTAQEDIGGRFVSLGRDDLGWSAYHGLQGPQFWGLMDNQRATLFGLESIQGFNPIQPTWFWAYVRAVQPDSRIAYNRAALERPRPQVLDVLGVGWIVGPRARPPMEGLTPVAHEDIWTLYRRSEIPPRAAFHPTWAIAGSDEEALDRVASEAFDPFGAVILLQDPGLAQGESAEARAAVYEPVSDQAARVSVEAPSGGVVLVRNVWDPHWKATVDGKPAPVLRADYLLQAIPVPEGSHVVELEYDDPSIGWGLLGSGVALLVLWGAALVMRTRRDSPEPSQQERTPAEQDDDQRPGHSESRKEIEPQSTAHDSSHDQRGDAEGGGQGRPLQPPSR